MAELFILCVLSSAPSNFKTEFILIQVLLIIEVIMEAIITVGDHIITDSQEIIMI